MLANLSLNFKQMLMKSRTTYYKQKSSKPLMLTNTAELPFTIGNKVMLLTSHHHQEFKKKGKRQAAKFIPVMLLAMGDIQRQN